MHFVYILKLESEKNSYYIGYTSNIERRLSEHARGTVITTHRLKNPKLLYYEAYSSKDLAQERECQLKRFGSAYTALLKRLGEK